MLVFFMLLSRFLDASGVLPAIIADMLWPRVKRCCLSFKDSAQPFGLSFFVSVDEAWKTYQEVWFTI